MSEVFSQVGGMRVGEGMFLAFNASWPSTKLRVTESQIELECLFQEWIFPKDSIKKLSRHQGMSSGGLRIEHGIPDYNPFIVFWTSNFEQLRQALEQKGYSVNV